MNCKVKGCNNTQHRIIGFGNGHISTYWVCYEHWYEISNYIKSVVKGEE